MKRIKILILSIILAVSADIFIGCSGSDEPELTEAQIRAKDSSKVYLALENGRLQYSKALLSNEQSDSKSSLEEFEAAVKQINKIESSLLDKYPAWKEDFNELATSVVQDYIISQNDIPDNSSVFKLAKRVNVTYDKVETKYYTNVFNPDDLPKGDDIKLEKNSYVNDYLNYFQTTGKKYMDKWLYRAGKYFNLMRSILRQHGVPEELIYLAMIESGLDPAISSWAGAIGMWQFMPTTGSAYGLYYDEYTDDKRDIEKATDAAARHMKDLYSNLGDWYLCLASYNAGQGRINSAIKKSGSKDFWTIRDYLPKETRNYVPQYIACALITIDPKAYGFNDVEYAPPIEYDRVVIKSQISISRIAELCESEVDKVRDLNSQMLKDVTPVFTDGYLIKIPKGTFNTFKKNYENASDFDKYGFEAAYDGDEGTTVGHTDASGPKYKIHNYSVEDPKYIISTSKRELVIHTLSDNEKLKSVADKYSVRTSDLRIWNHINYGKYPKKGDSLFVWLTPEKYKELYGVKEEEKINNKSEDKVEVTNNEKTENVKKDNENILVNKENSNNNDSKENSGKDEEVVVKKESKENTKEKSSKKKEKASAQTYTVKAGDNLTMIAGKYDVSVDELKDWNELETDKITVGQKLKIYSDKTVKKEDKTSKKKNIVYYKVKSGDNLTSVAEKYSVSVSEIKEWNELETDVIFLNQVLKIYSNQVAKDDSKETDKKKNSKQTYSVKEGDNLTQIADKFGVTVSNIKEWNDLESDVIYEGQVLKLYDTKVTKKEKNTKENNTKEKTKSHTVKDGETLSSIASKYDVSVSDIKKWNKLKSDEILVGQKLIVKK
jgi:membrane-bound lytic murein transglycosylase D